MSTAGKVLAVLVMLMSLVWMVLSAGVDQLNTNFNKKIYDLGVQLEKLEAQVDQTQVDLGGLKRLGCVDARELLDHELAAPRPPVGPRKGRSQIKNAALELAIPARHRQRNDGSQGRRSSPAPHRRRNKAPCAGLLAKTKSDVKELMDRCGELTNELLALRKEFNTTYHGQRRVARQDTSKAGLGHPSSDQARTRTPAGGARVKPPPDLWVGVVARHRSSGTVCGFSGSSND